MNTSPKPPRSATLTHTTKASKLTVSTAILKRTRESKIMSKPVVLTKSVSVKKPNVYVSNLPFEVSESVIRDAFWEGAAIDPLNVELLLKSLPSGRVRHRLTKLRFLQGSLLNNQSSLSSSNNSNLAAPKISSYSITLSCLRHLYNCRLRRAVYALLHLSLMKRFTLHWRSSMAMMC